MKTKVWVFLFLLVIFLCGGWMLWQSSMDTGPVVQILRDGEVLHTIDLSQVEEPYELTIPYGKHYNTLQITHDTLWVSQSDCGNQVCVHHGPLEAGGSPITCLPHHLIISWAESHVDA